MNTQNKAFDIVVHGARDFTGAVFLDRTLRCAGTRWRGCHMRL